MLHKWGVIPHPNGNRNSQRMFDSSCRDLVIVPLFDPSIPPPNHYSTNLTRHSFKPQFPANSLTSPGHCVPRLMDQTRFNPDGPPPGIIVSASSCQLDATFSEPSEAANFGSSVGLLAGPPVRPPVPPIGLVEPSKVAIMQQSSSSEQVEQKSPSQDPENQPNTSIGVAKHATAPIEILSINDQHEECIQILSTARTDLASLKTELQQIDKKLDDKMFLTKTLQIVTREKTRKLHQKIRGVSPSQTTAVELRELYTEAQNALSQQINVEKDLAEMEKFRAENLAARNLKNNEIQTKEDEVRDLEWQCKVMDTVFNRSSVLLKVSEALVQEPEETKIPGLIHVVDELKEKLESNPYILDEELSPPELAILETIYKSKKMGRVIKKLKKWWRVKIKYKPYTSDVPKLRSESPERRKRASTPIKSRGRGSVQAFDDESSFDRKQDERNKNRLYVPPIHSGFDTHPQSNEKPRRDAFRTLRKQFGRSRGLRRKRDEDHSKNRRSRSRSSTRQDVKDDNDDAVIYIKTEIRKSE